MSRTLRSIVLSGILLTGWFATYCYYSPKDINTNDYQIKIEESYNRK